MNRVIKILIASFVIFVISGCTSNVSDIEIDNSNLITMKMVDGSLTDSGFSFMIFNNSNFDYYYGPQFELEINKNNKWYKMDTIDDLVWIDVIYTIKANESIENKINWDSMYGKLSKGKYRLIKRFNGNSSSINIALYFEV